MTPSEINQILHEVFQKCIDADLTFDYTPSAGYTSIHNSDNSFRAAAYTCKMLIETNGLYHVRLRDLPAKIDNYKKASA